MSSAGRNTERAVQILDDVLLRAGAEGGRAFNIARTVLCALFLARELALTDDWGGKRTTFVALLLAMGFVVSLFFVVMTPRFRLTPARVWWARFAGTVLDAVLFGAIMLAVILDPYPTYRGLFMAPWVYVFGLVVAASGLRIDRSFVLISAGLHAVVLVSLGVVDKQVWAERAAWRPGDLAFAAALLIGSLVVGLAFSAQARNLALRGARRAIEAARAREKLGAYLGRVVAQEAMAADEIVLGGKRQQVAVLFSDLRGFTATAESLPPEELVAQLNAYLNEMVRAIDEAGGVVDKYLGDGIMAVFGAPTESADDAQRALKAARGMQERLATHNAARARRGLPPLEHGVGVHYGVAVAGNIGTVDQAQYTIVGDVVNVAARLEKLTKEQGASVLVSKDLVEAARKTGAVDDVTACGELALRGRTAPVEVFALKS